MDGSLVSQATLNILSLSRYFSAASFAFAVWEHAITFDLEVQLVWKLSRPSTKWAFLINRYGLILGILYSLFGHITYDSTTGACRLNFKAPVLEAAWALIVAFDVVMVGTITTNALDRPRRHNRELLGYLKSDSAVFFASLLLMRVAALVLISAIPVRHSFYSFPTSSKSFTNQPPNSLVYSCYITWPLTSAALSRFVLESETFMYQTSSRADYLTYEMESRRWKARVIEK
ncbi:hypothetical protein BC629DRAFT_1590253 [Irpex lacteus]|nr:hypothetical protein BC629DRAFT_1590253 [Irpex lacteus]